MTKGGKREGAGAKPRSDSPTIVRGIRFTQAEWDEIIARAYVKEITPSEYIRLKALEEEWFEGQGEAYAFSVKCIKEIYE